MNTGIEFAEKLSKAYSETCKPLCHELNIPQTAFDILLFLANNPEYKTARDIVEIRKIKANLVSVNVDKLVNEGYLERKPVENDRRKTELVCTKKAGTVIERGRRIQQQFTANLFAGIDEEQKKQLTYLRGMFASLLITGPFSILVGFTGGLMALNDRLKLRSMVIGEKGDRVYISSEECAIRVLEPELDKLWSPKGGQPVIITSKGGEA